MTHLTVGFSGSGASRRALRWALSDASATGEPVHVVAVDPGGVHHDSAHFAVEPTPSQALSQALGEELHRLPGRRPEVTTATMTGDPVANLLIASSSSSTLVLGCGRRVGPVGPGAGRVLRDLVHRVPVPLVLVGPQAVLATTRRLLVVSDDDDLTSRWALTASADRGAGLSLLTAWRGLMGVEGDRARAHVHAAHRHQRASAALAPGQRRPVRAEITEGAVHDVVAARVSVGDLVVVGRSEVRELPLRTLRAPVVVLPARVRTVVLPDTGAASDRAAHAGGVEGRRSRAGTQVSMSTGRDAGSRTT